MLKTNFHFTAHKNKTLDFLSRVLFLILSAFLRRSPQILLRVVVIFLITFSVSVLTSKLLNRKTFIFSPSKNFERTSSYSRFSFVKCCEPSTSTTSFLVGQ